MALNKSLLLLLLLSLDVQIGKSVSMAIDGLASLAYKHWLSGKIITAISNLINSSPDVFV